jgi:NAD kinase
MSLAPRLVVVTRRSEFELLAIEHGTANQARFALAERGRSLDELEARHAATEDAAARLLQAAPKIWRRTRIDRSDLTGFLFEPSDVVACVGQDGLVANVARYLDEQPVLGVNPDRAANEGVLVQLSPDEAAARLEPAARREVTLERRTMAQARLGDGRSAFALNDLFVGHGSHQSARYRLRYGEREERQSSSGVLVSTGTGASGWALSIQRGRAEPAVLPAPRERALFFFVREAWPGRSYGAELIAGRIDEGASLLVQSEMPERGVIFADGIEAGALEFAWGSEVTIGVAQRSLCLVGAGPAKPAARPLASPHYAAASSSPA